MSWTRASVSRARRRRSTFLTALRATTTFRSGSASRVQVAVVRNVRLMATWDPPAPAVPMRQLICSRRGPEVASKPKSRSGSKSVTRDDHGIPAPVNLGGLPEATLRRRRPGELKLADPARRGDQERSVPADGVGERRAPTRRGEPDPLVHRRTRLCLDLMVPREQAGFQCLVEEDEGAARKAPDRVVPPLDTPHCWHTI